MKRKIFAASSSAYSERELKNRRIAYRAALEGIVLLTNDGCLPLDQPGRVAIYGAGAAHTIKGGTGSGEVNERHSVTVLEGMEAAGFTVSSRSWLADYEKDLEQARLDWKASISKLGIEESMGHPFAPPCGRLVTPADVAESDTDTAFLILSRQAGEGADKRLESSDYTLTEDETAMARALSEQYKNFILVINSGSSMDLSLLDSVRVSAVIFLCQPGMEGGRAFADLVLGRTSPSGKLSDSWARSYADIPFGSEYSYLSGDTTREDYREGLYVGYRYYDSFGIRPRFPFGFGLSYTDFEIEASEVRLNGRRAELRAKVKNTGARPGREVVQLYVSAPEGRLDKEYQRLVCFAKTAELAPGGSEELSLSFDMGDCASYCEEEAAYLLEKGLYTVRLGNSSDATRRAALISLAETVRLAQLKNICPKEEKTSQLIAPPRPDEGPADCPVLVLDPAAISVEAVSYERPPIARSAAIDAVMARLSSRDKARLCVGEGILGMVRTKGVYTPGAVGRSTDKLLKKGLVNVNLCDGPAGLRILRESGLAKGGGIRFAPGNLLLSAMEAMPEGLLNLVRTRPDRHRLLYQYTTAFPVGTALAQSWNCELLEEIGRALSDEMSEYGISFWLGPAMNIHRNPLCGRNFEYFSEDPVLSGRTAAALVRGVQSVPGNYATIKHFACNNQEDNRKKSDSRVDERVLREIYLKGFEIAVRESAPASVMTSYNLVNGTYTPDSYDLVTNALRCEWGFDGVVMTDWFSTDKGCGRSDLALAAGNDWIMPGGASYRAELLKGLKNGSLTEEELDRAARNVARAILESRVAENVKPEELL